MKPEEFKNACWDIFFRGDSDVEEKTARTIELLRSIHPEIDYTGYGAISFVRPDYLYLKTPDGKDLLIHKNRATPAGLAVRFSDPDGQDKSEAVWIDTLHELSRDTTFPSVKSVRIFLKWLSRPEKWFVHCVCERKNEDLVKIEYKQTEDSGFFAKKVTFHRRYVPKGFPFDKLVSFIFRIRKTQAFMPGI